MIGAMVLAAGRSRRMGAVHKLVEDVGDRPMVVCVVDAALEAGANPVVVVVAPDDGQIPALLSDRPVRIVPNPHPERGMSASITEGILALDEARPKVSGALVLLADMPLVRASTLSKLMGALPPRLDLRPIVPVHRGHRGNPVLWPESRFKSLLRLEGDVGGKELLDKVPPIEVEVDDPGIHVDVDDPETLARIRSGRVDPELLPGDDVPGDARSPDEDDDASDGHPPDFPLDLFS